MKLMGKETVLQMNLHELNENRYVRYSSAQKGLPVVEHERIFEPHDRGVCYTMIMSYSPREGVKGLFDRWILKRSLQKVLKKSYQNYDHGLKYFHLEQAPTLLLLAF